MKKTIISCSVLIAFFELLIYYKFLDKAFYPNPIAVFINTWNLLFYDNLASELIPSMYRLWLAFLITLPIALVTAYFSSHWKFFDNYFNPIIAITFPLPKVALYPLMLLIFGIDSTSKIALIALGMFYLLFINFRIGFKRITSSAYSDIIKIYPIKRSAYFGDFLLKGAAQEIWTGIQIALNYGLTLVVVSETTASNNGIGYFIWKSWDQFKIINVYSGVFALSGIGFIQYVIFSKLIDRAREKTIS